MIYGYIRERIPGRFLARCVTVDGPKFKTFPSYDEALQWCKENKAANAPKRGRPKQEYIASHRPKLVICSICGCKLSRDPWTTRRPNQYGTMKTYGLCDECHDNPPSGRH